jgi:hypothetical protein
MLPSALLALLVVGANPYLEEGQRHHDALEYERAEGALRLAIQVPTSTQEERRRAHDLLARSLAAQGKLDQAQEVYRALLATDPHAPSPDPAPPRIRARFQAAKESLNPRPFVRLSPRPASPETLAFEVVDPWQVVASLVFFTGPAGGPFTPTSLTRRGDQALGAQPPGPRPLHVYAQAADAQGAVLATWRSAESPAAVGAPETSLPAAALVREGPSARPRWPAWSSFGAAAAALTVGAALAASAMAVVRLAERPGVFANQIDRLDARAAQKATAANVLIGAGLLCGAAGILWVSWP